MRVVDSGDCATAVGFVQEEMDQLGLAEIAMRGDLGFREGVVEHGSSVM